MLAINNSTKFFNVCFFTFYRMLTSVATDQ